MLYRFKINIQKNELNKLCENFKYSYIEQEHILTENGILKYDKGVLNMYKINFNDKNDLLLKNYIDNLDLYCSNNMWKKQYVCNYIPYIHKRIHIKRYNFSPRKNSPLTFCIEYIENEMVDHYFSTINADPNDILLKEDISLFLNYIK